MGILIDLAKEVKGSRDGDALAGLLGALRGLRCLKLAFSYADELTLHLGMPTTYRHPKLTDEVKGSWVLGARASWWSLLLTDPPFLIDAGPHKEIERTGEVVKVTGDEIEEKAAQLAGQIVTDTRLMVGPPGPDRLGFALFLYFSAGGHLLIFPGADDGDEALPDWELFTPHHTYIVCGPGPVWSYLRSDVPAAAR